MTPRTLAALLLAALSFVMTAPAQQEPGLTKDDDDIVKAGREDPYTRQDPELMKAAGIVSYGPFRWADGKTNEDVADVLGKGRLLWMETEHFRIGFNLRTTRWPVDKEKRSFLRDEIKAVRQRVKGFPAKPNKLTPWVRLHLYAYRFEKLYGEIQDLLGVTDADFGTGNQPPGGKYLGLPDKYLVLLVQKKSDLARYFDRFANQKTDTSMRWYHHRTNQLIAGVAVENLERFDSCEVHGHVLYMVTHNLLSGYKGFHMNLPLWFGEGLAHWYSRQVPSKVVNVLILDTESVSQDDKQANWAVKVRRRARHEGVCYPFETMAQWTDFEEMGYHAHAQSWSRVDYLLDLDREKVGLMIAKLKGMSPVQGQQVPPERVATMAQRLLIELFGLDGKTFDEKWRKWVLKKYPKK